MRISLAMVALGFAFGAVVAACVAAPGQLVAIGFGIAAVGLGWMAYRRRTSTGSARLGGAAAITVGLIGFGLGVARVAIILAAIRHVEALL
jgi:hypothetical protein